MDNTASCGNLIKQMLGILYVNYLPFEIAWAINVILSIN